MLGNAARPHVLLQTCQTHRTPKDDVMTDFIVTQGTVDTAVIALREARDKESSLTARVRIQGALAELTNPIVYKRRPDNDYTELVISQAGGDGDGARIRMWVLGPDDQNFVEFTNVPMHRVHAAIALLNGDQEETELTEEGARLLAISQAAQQRDLFRKFYPPYVAPGTKAFTEEELFSPDSVMCAECGAYVHDRAIHVTWHNKTLP